MNTSLAWIKEYVPDLDVEAQEYMDAMTLSGSKGEGFVKLDADLENIVIGQIEKMFNDPGMYVGYEAVFGIFFNIFIGLLFAFGLHGNTHRK